VAVGWNDTIVSVGPYTSRMTVFQGGGDDGTCQRVATIGSTCLEGIEFDDCNDVALTCAGVGCGLVAAVSDSSLENVQIFYLNGGGNMLIQSIPGFCSPNGIAFDKDGRLFVADEGSVIIMS
jgi:hypothetical protein